MQEDINYFEEKLNGRINNDVSFLSSYDYETRKYRVLSNDEIKEYFKEYKSGNMEAFDIIIKHNLRLVKSIVYQKFRYFGISLNDLIQEGNEALIHAVMNYDYNSDYNSDTSFTIYAYSYIYYRILGYINHNNSLVSISKDVEAKLGVINGIEKQIIYKYGYIPSSEELSDITGYSIEEIEKLREYNKKTILFSELSEEEEEFIDSKVDIDYDVENEALDKVQFKKLYISIMENPSFTKKEKIVFEKLFVEGLTGSQAARELGVFRQTVSATKENFIRKIKRHNINNRYF